MARKCYKPEDIVGPLIQADGLHSQGRSMAEAIRHGHRRGQALSPAHILGAVVIHGADLVWIVPHDADTNLGVMPCA